MWQVESYLRWSHRNVSSVWGSWQLSYQVADTRGSCCWTHLKLDREHYVFVTLLFLVFFHSCVSFTRWTLLIAVIHRIAASLSNTTVYHCFYKNVHVGPHVCSVEACNEMWVVCDVQATECSMKCQGFARNQPVCVHLSGGSKCIIVEVSLAASWKLEATLLFWSALREYN
jgi:hypothetical protein